jgi:hypothetical protein
LPKEGEAWEANDRCQGVNNVRGWREGGDHLSEAIEEREGARGAEDQLLIETVLLFVRITKSMIDRKVASVIATEVSDKVKNREHLNNKESADAEA